MKQTQEWWDCCKGLGGLKRDLAPSERVVALQLLQVRHKAVPGYKLSLQVQICIKFFERAQLLVQKPAFVTWHSS